MCQDEQPFPQAKRKEEESVYFLFTSVTIFTIAFFIFIEILGVIFS